MIPNPYAEERPKSKGEQDQEDAALAIMVTRLLAWSFTDHEKDALAVLIGAVKREAPKTEKSSLVKLIRMVTAAVAPGGAG
jgi:hypothetical protein